MSDNKHKPIQLLRNSNLFDSKAIGIKAWTKYINENIEDFSDGEEIVIRYLDNATVQSVVGIVSVTDGKCTISTGIDRGDTKVVIESETEPEDKDAVWITDGSGGEEEEKDDITVLTEAVATLIDTVGKLQAKISKYEAIIENGIDAGELSTNSTKQTLEDSAEQQIPDILADDTGYTPTTGTTTEEKPYYPQYGTPNVSAIVMKVADTEAEIFSMAQYILPNEFIYCLGNNGLYARNGKTNKIVKINGTSSSTGDSKDIEEIMSGITQNGAAISAITFVAPSGAYYNVTMGDDGNLVSTITSSGATSSLPSGYVKDTNGYATSLLFPKLYINSIYCGGVNSDEHSYNYCSHNFVELSNLTGADINLNGLLLKYTIDGSDWKTLKLVGTIKNGSTFLIRGAQCSVLDANTTKMIIDTYDMEWYDGDDLIKFNNQNAKFYLTYNTGESTMVNPYISTTEVQYGYIDLVGINASDASESAVTTYCGSDKILMKYYNMDPVSQATKGLDKRNNANDWTYVDLTKENGDVIPNIDCYKPMASAENKNIFFNKTSLVSGAPNMITCTFGIQATDNGEGATRCFNWVSKGIYDEYLWYRVKGNDSWIGPLESIKGEDKTKEDGETINSRYYYNRLIQEYTDGSVFTAHKQIVSGLSAGTYEYCAGHKNSDNTPNTSMCTSVREFTVLSDTTVNDGGCKFVQTSDQQGFNWEEYQTWKYSAKEIITKDTDLQFMVNTGDMTQNGNRMNEWIDYFNAKEPLNNLVEMATIGNNDLSPKVLYTLGNGSDSSKISPNNILFFYTFEIDENNLPRFICGTNNAECYVPSLYSFNYGNIHFLCVNSEITTETESSVFGISGDSGTLYAKIMDWCKKDLELNVTDSTTWTVAYCHEMPFTIITNANVNGWLNSGSTQTRGGSHLNTVALKNTSTGVDNTYWFSKFCQNNNIRLVIGGHKHTQSTTYPLLENSGYSMIPKIQVTSAMLNTFFNGSTELKSWQWNVSGVTYTGSYPDKWFEGESISTAYSAMTKLCDFVLVDKITAPIYSMSQATGYKTTSNKELPACSDSSSLIPWEAKYFPCKIKDGADSPNSGQKYPFYTVWEITKDAIVGKVYYIMGIFNSQGKFNINIEGPNAKNRISNVSGKSFGPTLYFKMTINDDFTISTTE